MKVKRKLYIIVFLSNTKPGKRFDLLLLWAILLSVLTVVLESVPSLGGEYPRLFDGVEWVFTFLFSAEYVIRIWISPRADRYIFSFWGMIDFLAAIPMYLSLILPGMQFIFVIRLLRFLRVFRILKIARLTDEARILSEALKASLYKVTIFLTTVLILVLILGTLMYVVEGQQQGFSSIPQSVYWAIVTITTVGYGDLVPQTVIGKFISSVIMITGYAIIAVPTGIVTAEISRKGHRPARCGNCGQHNPAGSKFCNHCGHFLDSLDNA